MTRCPICMDETTFDLCLTHLVTEEGWAAGNRLLCDLIHRRIVPARLPYGERDPDVLSVP